MVIYNTILNTFKYYDEKSTIGFFRPRYLVKRQFLYEANLGLKLNQTDSKILRRILNKYKNRLM